jgi:hypothetical protein
VAKQGSPTTTRIDVPAVRLAQVRLQDVELDDEFVDRVIDLAEMLPETDRKFVRMQIRAQAKNYLFWEAIGQRYLSESESRAALKKLERPFRQILETLDALSIEHSMVLDAMICLEAGGKKKSGELIASKRRIEILRDAVTATVTAYKPKTGNPELRRLEFVVGTLMLLFEMASGQRAKVSMTKDGEHAPRLTSPQAKAIALLLTGIDPSLDERTIVMKIHKVSKVYRNKSLKKFEFALWLPTQGVFPILADEEKT